MQLLNFILVFLNRLLHFKGHLLAEIKLLSKIHLVHLINVLIVIKELKTTEDLKELDLPHPLLVDLHFAPKKVHPLLLKRVSCQLNHSFQRFGHARQFVFFV